MVKEKVDMVKIEALEQENKRLKEKIAEQEAHSMQDVGEELGDRVANEIKKIRQKGKSTANTITVTEKNDHVNVALWTKWGDMIGPMHPDNAIQTLSRFADIGIVLSVDKPTGEQVQAYLKSPAGQKYLRIEKEKRELKNKSRRSGQMDRLCMEIAKMSGTTVDAINNILKPTEVRK